MMLTSEDDILSKAQEWRQAGLSVAIATVVETWGSAPRPVGSHLVIDGAGSCVEVDVVSEAQEVMEDGKPRLLEFGVADETAWRAGLSCGGRIKVYLERLD
jgi:xanthine/CO dehydrogenase XdhC/CoxF family maturation factor